MKLEFVPLLQVQRDLYDLPRGMERFREYLRTMIDARTGDLELPLVSMNPMGKDHLPPFLDGLLAMNADRIAADATAAAAAHFADDPGAYRVALVVSDDRKGGWTNRFTSELGYRFEQGAYARRGWIVPLVWTSESPTPASVRTEVIACIARAAYVIQHGEARTLGDRLAQEAFAMRIAGVSEPVLDADDLEYTRGVLEPLFERTDMATHIAALFGDAAARELGHTPLGLSPRAGLALAVDMSRALASRTSAPRR